MSQSSQSNQNLGDLSRSSSSASKVMRNMGINPGVQAKLLAFQAKRQQQMQQTKNQGSSDSISSININNNNNNNNSPSLNPNRLSLDSNSNLVNLDTKLNEQDLIYDPEDESLNVSPLNSKLNASVNNNSPSTPLSLDSSTFSSPIVTPSEERESLSRRTSFRLSNNNNNCSTPTNSNDNDNIIRRTSFRIKNHNSTVSTSTAGILSDDSEDYPNTLDFKKTPSSKNQTISPMYTLNKNINYLSKAQKIQSTTSSSESLGNSTSFNSHPPRHSLPSVPSDGSIESVSSTHSIFASNTDASSTSVLKLSSHNSTTSTTSQTSSKLSLSQRRGMKLNLSSFNSNDEHDQTSNESVSSIAQTPIPLTKESILEANNLKNKMNKLTLNSAAKNNRSNMNRLRDNSLPARRNPMNLNLNNFNNNNNNNNSPTNSKNKNKDNNGFTPFAKYIDIKSGSLNFSGKASLHSKGIDFSNGSSFRISMDDLEILEELGHGNYGVVSKVLHKPTGIIMAMKEVRLELDDSKFSQILMELEVLHSCNSDCIVEFYGAFFVEGAVYMCMEYMKGGSLDKVYDNGIPEDALAYITKRVVIGLKKLKDEKNIIHRDVKPTNMLVNEIGKVKLCDFGVSGNLVASLARTNIGCQSYMAPERIKHTNPDVSTYSVQSDIWSLGLSILEIAKGCYPYPPETYNNVFSQLSAIVDGEPPELPIGKFSSEAQNFVRQCLHKNPNKRPTYGQLLLHPWLQMYPDIQGQETLKHIVAIAIEKRESGKSEDSEKSVPALHSGLQV